LKKDLVLIPVLVFLIVSLTTTEDIRAQVSGTISINADGSVKGTDKIQRNGNTYHLTDNLFNSPIIILLNNIVLDGAGFTLQGMAEWDTPAAINLTCSNVTVKNFNIIRWEVGILGAWNNNKIINNTVTKCERAMAIYADNYDVTRNSLLTDTYGIRILNGNNHSFSGNQLIDNSFGFSTNNSTGNIVVANDFQNNMIAVEASNSSFTVYHNNFIDQNNDFIGGFHTHILSTGNAISPWDNGYPSGGNYYSDYATRFPNATEIDKSGIGSAAYIVDNYSGVVDRYPLLNPVNITKAMLEVPSPELTPPSTSSAPSVSITPPFSPVDSPTATQPTNLSPSPSVPELSYCPLVILLISLTTVLLVGLKRKENTS
jgi:hypothetical protein